MKKLGIILLIVAIWITLATMMEKKTLTNYIYITKPKSSELKIGSSYLFRDTFSFGQRKFNSQPFKIVINFKVNSDELEKSDYQKIVRSEIIKLFQNLIATPGEMKKIINDNLKIKNLELETVYVNDFLLFDHFIDNSLIRKRIKDTLLIRERKHPKYK